MLSYARSAALLHRREDTFEEWVTNRFGRRLFETFFRTYTEKVWGISCRELKAEWAAQRIRNLSLPTVSPEHGGQAGWDRDLVDRGVRLPVARPRYDVAGAAGAHRAGGRGHPPERLMQHNLHQGVGASSGVLVADNGQETLIEGTDFISSMPLSEFVRKLNVRRRRLWPRPASSSTVTSC